MVQTTCPQCGNTEAKVKVAWPRVIDGSGLPTVYVTYKFLVKCGKCKYIGEVGQNSNPLKTYKGVSGRLRRIGQKIYDWFHPEEDE